jgi:hypothetical protein
MSGPATPAEPAYDARALVALGDALDRLGTGGMHVLAEAAVLLHAHPHWAVWLPADGRAWTAVRPAGSMPPGPDAPTIWVRADTADELAVRMTRADSALSGGPGG